MFLVVLEDSVALLPDPYGISFDGLADYFRAVYIQHVWPGLDIRFDVRFKSDKPGPWETGEWLVKDGGRITDYPSASSSLVLI